MSTTNIKIYCDGGSRGNPGRAASAFAVVEGGKTTKEESGFIGITTNNVAEYTAVKNALEWLNQSKFNKENVNATIVLDSELVTKQINGDYKVKSANLKQLYKEVKDINVLLMCGLKFVNVPRIKNKLADTLVNEALDSLGPDEN